MTADNTATCEVVGGLRPPLQWGEEIASIPIYSDLQQPLRVPRDHQFLIGGNAPRRNSRPECADAPAARRIRRGVKLDAEPCGVAADAFANRRRILADAGGEYDRVQAAQRGGERSELASDTIAIEIDRQLGMRVVR